MAVEQGQLQMNLKQELQKAQLGCYKEPLQKTETTKPVNNIRRQDQICELSPPHPAPCVSDFTACFTHQNNYFERVPPEIIIKVFSYLDAASLFSVGFVNRQFYRLANDRTIWYNLYAYELANKKWRSLLTVMEGKGSTEEQDLPAQVWKKRLFREMGCNKDLSWKNELKDLNSYTAMPQQTEEVLRRLRVRWEITLILTNGLQHNYQQSQAFFSDSSVTVCWNSAVWPHVRQVLSLHLHGVIYPAKTSSSNRPPWRSLINKLEVKAARWVFYGSDQLVKLLKLGEGVTVGVWRGCWKIAFIMATLHFHQLVERSVLGTVFCPYRPPEIRSLSSDVTVDYYLRGYSLLVLLHNAVRTVMQCHYSEVLIKRDVVQQDYVYFRPANVSIMTPWPERCPFSNQISFPWKALDLQGDIENCCMMTLSVLDEKNVPMWCVSSPVTLLPHSPVTSDSEMGKHYVMRYVDEVGKVRAVLQCLDNPQVYFLDQLQIWIRLARVNAHLKSSSEDLI